MSGPMLVALVAAVVAVACAGLAWRLSREVRRLRTDVAALASEPPQPARPAQAAEAGPPALPPVADLPLPDPQPDLVLTPMPIGPAEPEPDLTVARVASVTLAVPLVKVVAFSHGVRRALLEESRMRVGHAFRKELRRQHKLRRRRTAAGPPRASGRRP